MTNQEKFNRAKLIREMYAGGKFTQKELAQQFNLNHSYLNQILKNNYLYDETYEPTNNRNRSGKQFYKRK